jgi:phage FluMu protein Com
MYNTVIRCSICNYTTLDSAGNYLHAWWCPQLVGSFRILPGDAERGQGQIGDRPVENMGWECPRCHQINAPHVGRCTCFPDGE